MLMSALSVLVVRKVRVGASTFRLLGFCELTLSGGSASATGARSPPSSFYFIGVATIDQPFAEAMTLFAVTCAGAPARAPRRRRFHWRAYRARWARPQWRSPLSGTFNVGTTLRSSRVLVRRLCGPRNRETARKPLRARDLRNPGHGWRGSAHHWHNAKRFTCCWPALRRRW
jgi:hypothetical protein